MRDNTSIARIISRNCRDSAAEKYRAIEIIVAVVFALCDSVNAIKSVAPL